MLTKEIPLTKGKYALVDDEDYGRLSRYSWHYDKNGYAYRRKTTGHYENKLISMHREIVGNIPESKIIDHKNRRKLDNRKENLRITSQSNNAANSPPRKGSSKYKGVHWSNEYKRWVAKIEKEGKHYYLGMFDCEDNAAVAYNKKAVELYGDYALINETPKYDIDYTKERPSRETSQYFGVSKVNNRYRSVVRNKGEKPVHIGYFRTEKLAALARDMWMDSEEYMNFKGDVITYG